jgi:predicted Zn-dependent protease
MLADAPREESFVFQIAHAVAHIASRHAARLESRMDLLAMPEINQNLPDQAGAGPAAFASFSRRFELDADSTAVRSMSEAGFDPNRVLPLGDLGSHDSGRSFASLTVKPERRGDNLAKVVSRLPKRDYLRSEAAFIEAKGGATNLNRPQAGSQK